MSKEPRNRYFGTSLTEWINKVPNELEVDAVGLWQIVGSGQDGFELQGQELADFVRRCVVALLEKGAVPVRASENPDEFWIRQMQYNGDTQEIARRIVDEWIVSGIDPDHDGIWFSRLE